MISKTIEEGVRGRFERLSPALDERLRRLWAANEALSLGPGGIACVERATAISRTTIREGGAKELGRANELVAMEEPVRRPGFGRPPITETDPTLVAALEQLLDPVTHGDPMSPLRWTTKSARKLAEELTTQGHLIGRQKVTELLRELKYSLQGSRKSKEDASNPDRDEQLRQINRRVTDFHRRSQPVVSVDTKKKELVGECAKGGREWSPEGTPPKAKVHDFPDPKVPKAVPYGIYDLQLDEGWVNVGISHAEFAVASLSTWWSNMRRWAYPEATKLLATADAGGSNSARSRLWQVSLQRFADETGLTVAVCH